MADTTTTIPNLTGERDVDFVLANLRDVAAITQLWARAEKAFEDWVHGELRGALREECADVLGRHDMEMRNIDAPQVSWQPRTTPVSMARTAPSLWLWTPSGLKWVLAPRSVAETAGPCFYVWQFKGKDLDAWVRFTERSRTSLARAGLRVLAHAETDKGDGGGRTLISYPLDHVFKPAIIAEPGALRRALAEAASDFTRKASAFLRAPGTPMPVAAGRIRSRRAPQTSP